MWELLESFFYYLRYKNKKLPLLISLVLILIVMILSYISVQKEPDYLGVLPTLSPSQTILPKISPTPHLFPIPLNTSKSQKEKDLDEIKEMREEFQETLPLVILDPEKNDSDVISNNYERTELFLGNSLLKEGLDPMIAKVLMKTLKEDFINQAESYDIYHSIRKAIGPEASSQEVQHMYDLIMKSSEDAIREMNERGERHYEQPNAPTQER